MAVKIVRWIIVWKEIHFADLVKDVKSVAGFSPSHQFRIGRNDATYSFKMATYEFWASFETNFFGIAGTLKAETSVSGKPQCLLAIGEDKKVNIADIVYIALCRFRSSNRPHEFPVKSFFLFSSLKMSSIFRFFFFFFYTDLY